MPTMPTTGSLTPCADVADIGAGADALGVSHAALARLAGHARLAGPSPLCPPGPQVHRPSERARVRFSPQRTTRHAHATRRAHDTRRAHLRAHYIVAQSHTVRP